LFFADGAEDLIQSGAGQFRRFKGRLGGKQLVEQHAKRVDVTARIHIEAPQAGLFRTHVGGGAGELLDGGVQRLARQTPVERGLGDAKVNHLGKGAAVLLGDKDVRWFEVAVNDALLVCVLNRLAHLNEELEAFAERKRVGIAVVGDFHPGDEFHNEIRVAGRRGAAIEDLGDAGVVHQGQRLAFRLEACNDLLGVHAGLDDLQCDAPPHRLLLLGKKHDAKATRADAFDQPVATDAFAGPPVAGFLTEMCIGLPGHGNLRPGLRRGKSELEQTTQALAAGRAGGDACAALRALG